MSKSIRPLELPSVRGATALPAWLKQHNPHVRPTAFGNRGGDAQDSTQSAPEPAPAPKRPSAPLRRSSLPPPLTRPPQAVRIASVPPPAGIPSFGDEAPTEAERAFADAALELATVRARALAQVEGELLELAVAVAEAIIGREIERDPTVLEGLARAALQALGDTSEAKLRVSRDAHRALCALHGDSQLELEGVRVELVLDHSLEGLAVIAENGASRADGRVSERLAMVRRALEAEHRRQAAGEDL